MILLILSFLVMLIPAYLLARIFFRVKLLMSIAISIGFAITISIVSGFLLNFIGISTLSLWVFYFILSIVLFLIVYSRKIRLIPSIELDKKELIILLIVLVMGSIMVYIPRADYLYPNHLDEWDHLSIANKIVETGHLFNSPYGNSKEYDLETGTHIFIAEVFLLMKAKPILEYRFLPMLFVFLTSLILFISIYYLTNKFWTGILGILFLTALKSNANFLGIWLFTPFSMAFPIVFLFLYLFSRGIRNGKNEFIIAAIILLLTVIMFHASTAIVLGVVALIYLFIEMKYLKKHYIMIALSFTLLIFAGLIFSKFMLNKGIKETINIVLDYRFPLGITYSYNYFLVYGIIASIFAFFGLLIALKNKKLKIYSVFWIVAFVYYLVSYFVPYTLYIDYLRIFYLLMIASVVLSGFGAYYIIKSLLGVVKHKYLKIAVLVIIFLILFLFQFNHYYKADLKDPRELRTQWHRYIDDNNYETLNWLEKSDIEDKKILSMPRIGNAIPLSGNYPSARIRQVHGFPEEVTDSKKFFGNSTCDDKKQIVEKYKSDYALSGIRIECDFLKLIYKGKNYVYSVS